LSHSKVGTVLGVNPPSRFGEFRMEGRELVEFVEKPELHPARINRGYFFFRCSLDQYLSQAEDRVLEREPLLRLARDGQRGVGRLRAVLPGCRVKSPSWRASAFSPRTRSRSRARQ